MPLTPPIDKFCSTVRFEADVNVEGEARGHREERNMRLEKDRSGAH